MVVSDGSVLVMGGYAGGGTFKNDVWKTVDGGASWTLVTSSAGWTGKKIFKLSNSLPLLPSMGDDILVDSTATATVCLVSLLQM